MSAGNTSPLTSLLMESRSYPIEEVMPDAWNELVAPAISEATFGLDGSTEVQAEDVLELMYRSVTNLARDFHRGRAVSPYNTYSAIATLIAAATVVSRLAPMPNRYQSAIRELAHIASRSLPTMRKSMIQVTMQHAWFTQMIPKCEDK